MLALGAPSSLVVVNPQIHAESSACPTRHWQEAQKTVCTRVSAGQSQSSRQDESHKKQLPESQHRRITRPVRVVFQNAFIGVSLEHKARTV